MGEAKNRGDFNQRQTEAIAERKEKGMDLKGEERIVTTYALNTTSVKIIAQFSANLNNLTMAPAEAVRMAQILLSCAKELDPESVKDHTWPGMEIDIKKSPLHPPAGEAKPS